MYTIRLSNSLCFRAYDNSRIENGRTNITLKTVIVLSIALDIKVQELFQLELSEEI